MLHRELISNGLQRFKQARSSERAFLLQISAMDLLGRRE